jgi:ATP-binding cassette, subfamily B, bacterial
MNFFGGLGEDKYDRQYEDAYLIKRILSYFAAHRRATITIVVLVSIISISRALTPIFISIGIDELEANASNAALGLLVGALLVTVLIEYGIRWIGRRLIGQVIGSVISQMRKDAFAAAVERDLAFYDENKSGKIVSRITNDTQELAQVTLLSLDIIGQIVDAAVLMAVLFTREWRLTLIMFMFTPIVVGTALAFRRLARVATRQGSRAMAIVNDTIQETVSGIGVAKNFRQEGMIYNEFVEVNTQSYNINMRRGFVLALVFPTLNALAGFAIGTVVYVGGLFVAGGTMNYGSWYLFVQGVDKFWFPFINISAFWSQLQAGFSAVERIFALIDADNTIIQNDQQPAKNIEGHIEFDHVTFRYQTGEPILRDFDLDILKGESIAFVGHTGAGKSTIVKLITRFYEFQEGQILVDGRDIRSFDLQSYRSRLGLVPQQPFLFSGTIADNIRYARPEATDAEVKAVAYSIGNGEWLETLPDGLQTDVGERGARLSMGQRQLVSLLRVLLQKPAIFILDEATASIDPFTEMQIQEALNLILKQSTSILIAHRLSTVRSADRIIVLRQGEIIEEGSHESLMEQGGHYAELYNTYFRHQSLSYVENSKEMFAKQAGD